MNTTTRVMFWAVRAQDLYRVSAVHALLMTPVFRQGGLAVGGGRDHEELAGLAQDVGLQEPLRAVRQGRTGTGRVQFPGLLGSVPVEGIDPIDLSLPSRSSGPGTR